VSGKEDAMTPTAELERNKKIVRSFKECQGTPDEATVMREILSPNYRRLRGGMANLAVNAGGQNFPETLHGLRAAFPDRVDVIGDIIAEGDRVGMIWRLKGTHQGNLFGIAPTGRKIDIWEIGVFRVIDGKITEGWFMADEVGVLRQLGVNLPARSDGTRITPVSPASGEFSEVWLKKLNAEPPGIQRDNKIIVARSKLMPPPKEDRAHHTLRHWGMQHMRDYAEANGVEKFDPTSAFEDRRDHITGLIAEGERVWMLFNLRGHNTASFYGLAPTGRFVEMAEVGIMQFDQGRWTDSWYYADGLAMLLHLNATHLIDAMPKA
jgi:predicted ester cyclase